MNNPLNDTSGIMNISQDGNLVILNGKEVVIWSSNVSNPISTAQLLDTKNLVFKDDINIGELRLLKLRP